MRKIFYFAVVIFIGCFYSISAQDLIILRDGNIIEARVTEISQTGISYKRFNHLDGPVIIIARGDVLSIRYENKTVELINPVPVTRQQSNQTGQSLIPQNNTPVYQTGDITLLQQVLNRMPAIRIAGNNLKFEFTGETWIARVNGENFSAGIIEYEETSQGAILTLKQTHIWPGSFGRTAGRIASFIPGGNAVSGVLNTAGNIAGAAGAVEMSGADIVLEYIAGPPASLKLVSNSGNRTANSRTSGNSEKSANAVNNWLSGEIGLLGIGVRYERMRGEKFSLSGNAYYNFSYFFPMVDTGVDIALRYYPFGKIFFIGTGLGYHIHNSYNYWFGPTKGVAITPEIGWKIDAGKAGGFFIQPGVKVPITLGKHEIWWYDEYESKFSVTFGLVPYFGMGVSF